MPRCCGGASCSCVIQPGNSVDITGTGSSSDPFVISADVGVAVRDNLVFDLVLTGLGTELTPWTIEAHFAPSAKLNDLPDVVATAPTNGQVLAFDSASQTWKPAAPTSAASGAVSHDTSLAGDGSVGTPLQIQEDPARMLATTPAGLGLSDAGMNSVVRRYADAAARSAAAPAPVANALSILGTVPGQIDYWTGTAWAAAGIFGLNISGEEFYELSGPYTGAQRITFMVRNVETTTDVNGQFDAIAPADLAGKAGVLTASVQPTAPNGPSSITTPFGIMLAPLAGGLRGVAYRVDDGEPLSLSPVACTVIALTY
jgi:hypothetical protein